MEPSRVKSAVDEATLAAQRPELFRRLLQLGIAGIGIGAAGRTAIDMMGQTPEYKMPFVSPGPSTLEIPVPEEEPPAKPQTALARLTSGLKHADWAGELSKRFPHMVGKIPLIGPTLNTIERGASSADRAWWNAPAAAATGAAGLGLGWGLSDWLLGKSRKNQTDDELARAKQVYQQALLDEGAKQAGEQDPINQKLDTLFDMVEKTAEAKEAQVGAPEYASWYNPFAALGANDAGNAVAGAYLTALGALTAGTGYAGYQWAKSRSPSTLLQKALRARANRLWQTTSQPIEAVPQPMKQEEAAMAA